LIFLPPYSPDFNPIEESFSCGVSFQSSHSLSLLITKLVFLSVKAYLCQHYRQFQDSETPALDLELACYAALTPEKVYGWFSHLGYV
ncbi:hypothetical protein BDV98DRAFT_479117, partial [Pterulicium gracile]